MAKLTAMKQVPVLNESIPGALCTLDQFFVRLLHVANTVVEVLLRQPQYHLFHSSYHNLKDF